VGQKDALPVMFICIMMKEAVLAAESSFAQKENQR
jgi:hypothetical protein